MRICSYCHKTCQWFYSSLTFSEQNFTFCSEECYRRWAKYHLNICFCCNQKIVDLTYRIQFGDGRICCMKCYQKAILNDEQKERSLKKVLLFFKKKYNYSPPCGVVPQLCDNFIMTKNFKSFSNDIWGIYGHEDNGNDLKCQIRILRGLRNDLFENVLAHEIAHDLMQHRWGYTSKHIISEGFAEYMAYKYNMQNRRKKMCENMLHSHRKNPYGESGDPYSEGLHLYLEIEKKSGEYRAIEQFVTDFFREGDCFLEYTKSKE